MPSHERDLLQEGDPTEVTLRAPNSSLSRYRERRTRPLSVGGETIEHWRGWCVCMTENHHNYFLLLFLF